VPEQGANVPPADHLVGAPERVICDIFVSVRVENGGPRRRGGRFNHFEIFIGMQCGSAADVSSFDRVGRNWPSQEAAGGNELAVV
jgi:hypothetical protein